MFRLPSTSAVRLLRCGTECPTTALLSSTSPPPPAVVKFSETQTYKRTQHRPPPLSQKDVGIEGYYSAKYGWTPGLGQDWYDTFDYQNLRRYSVILSMSAMLIYFGILREENDIDVRLVLPLWYHVPAIEKDMLEKKLAIAEARHENTDRLRVQMATFDRRQQEYLERKGLFAQAVPTDD